MSEYASIRAIILIALLAAISGCNNKNSDRPDLPSSPAAQEVDAEAESGTDDEDPSPSDEDGEDEADNAPPPVEQPNANPLEIEPSAHRFLSRDHIALPERSQIITSHDLVAGCGNAPESAGIDGYDSGWAATPTWIPGTGRYDNGEYVWSDYPFDDKGDGSFQYPGQGAALTESEGRAGIANELLQRFGSNTADVVEFRAKQDAAFLYLQVKFNFLNATDAVVVGLGFDTDQSAVTGFSEWPLGANIASPDFGFELFLTVHGECAKLHTAQGARVLDQAGGAIRTGTRDNILEIALPLELLNLSTSLSIVGGSGLWDAANQQWMAVSQVPGVGVNNSASPRGKTGAQAPEVFNLLFRDDEEPLGNQPFQNRNQTQTLRDGISGHYALSLDLTKLVSGVTDPVNLRLGDARYFSRVYKSRLDAEGITGNGNTAVYLSRYQPYMIYIPACFEMGCEQWPESAKAPLAIGLHGGGGDHTAMAPEPDIPQGGSLYGLSDTFAAFEDESAPVVALLLGRGHQSPSWRGYGEIDALEVLEDVRTLYHTDRQRQTIWGVSQGGYGTMRIAGLYPDIWNQVWVNCPVANEASGRNEQGQVEPSTVPFVIDPMLSAILNVPFRLASGVFDPLAPITVDRRLRDYAFNAGLDARYTEYQTGSHCFDSTQLGYSFVSNEARVVAANMKQPKRTTPARIRYSIDPRQYPTDLQSSNALYDIRDVGIAYQNVYWLQDLQMRPGIEDMVFAGQAAGGLDESLFGKIDITSRALPGWDIATEDCGSSTGTGVDGDAGGNPDAEFIMPTPHEYQCQGQLRMGEPEKVLDLSVQNLISASVDLRSASLTEDFLLRAKGDGQIELKFLNGDISRAEGLCVDFADRVDDAFVVDLTLSEQLCLVEFTP